MKKKILFLITKSNFGGAQRYVYELATALSKDEYDIAVAFGGVGDRGSDAGSLKTMLEEHGIRTLFLSRFTRDINFVNDAKLFFDILALLRKERPDILHINSSKAGGLGALAGRLSGTRRIVFTAHGWPHQEKRPLLQKALIYLASWLSVLFSDITIAVSERDFKTAPTFLKKHAVRLIHNGVQSFTTLSRKEARTTIERATGKPLPQSTLTVGAIAELTKNKGLGYLVSALVNVPDAQLIIIGQGEERGRLELLALDAGVLPRVTFAGFIPDARRLLSAFDVYALTSLKEGLPYALLEAGSAALPVVATKVGGVPEIIEDGVNGLLIPREDSRATAVALMKFSDAAVRSTFGAANREKILKEFSFEEMLTATRLLYDTPRA